MKNWEETKMERKPWEQVAIEIGEEAARKYGSNIDESMEYINESVDSSEHVIITAKAWETVFDARTNATEVFDMSHDNLIDTEGNTIQPGEDIDSLMTRLAYWIMYNRASMAYEATFFEKTEGGNKK